MPRQLELLGAGDFRAGPIVFEVMRDAFYKFGRPTTDELKKTVGAWCRAEVDRRMKASERAADRPKAVREAQAELAAQAAVYGGVDDEVPAF